MPLLANLLVLFAGVAIGTRSFSGKTVPLPHHPHREEFAPNTGAPRPWDAGSGCGWAQAAFLEQFGLRRNANRSAANVFPDRPVNFVINV